MNWSFSQEPAVWIGIADAIIVLAITFGVPIDAEQKGAIDALLAAVSAVLIRSQVTPVVAPPAPSPVAPPLGEH